jgi:hypothetical protein
LLRAGFRVAHLHGNNNQDMYQKENYSIPKVIEVTFVSKGEVLDHCLQSQLANSLDHANNPDVPEISSGSFPL